MFKNFIKKRILYIILLLLGIGLILYALSSLSGELLLVIVGAGAVVALIGFFQTIKKDAVDSALNKDKLNRLSKEHEDLKRQHLKVVSENKRMQDMKINVSNIKPLVELGLFEAETEFTQFVDQYFDEHFNEINDEGMIELIKSNPSNYSEKYADNPIRIFGALHFKLDAIYGIKVDEIKVNTYEENGLPKVKVYGAKPKFLSFKSRDVLWKNPIALKYSSPLIGKETWKTDNKLLPYYNKFIEERRTKTIKDSERGPKELEWIKKPLENQIKSVLEMMFFKGYVLEFVEESDEHFISLNDFANSKLIENSNLQLLNNLSEKEIE
ncbi:MAG: hypothetical protein R2836_08910 [Chitinophagales bacterium]|nr:hypothetical protein [Chitinophagales bacterium]